MSGDLCTWAEQNLLTGKVRFKKEDKYNYPDWDEMKLKNIIDYKNSKHDLKDVDNANPGKYPLYTTAGEYKRVDFYDMETNYIGLNLRGAPGKAWLMKAGSSMNSTFCYLTIKEDLVDTVHINYLYYQLSQIHWNKYIQGSTIKGIVFNDFKNERIPLPVFEEQGRINNFFVACLRQLRLMERELELAELFKKGLLQQLFV